MKKLFSIAVISLLSSSIFAQASASIQIDDYFRCKKNSFQDIKPHYIPSITNTTSSVQTYKLSYYFLIDKVAETKVMEKTVTIFPGEHFNENYEFNYHYDCYSTGESFGRAKIEISGSDSVTQQKDFKVRTVS
jgi:hypothetical protein